jgi:hypothetical protein
MEAVENWQLEVDLKELCSAEYQIRVAVVIRSSDCDGMLCNFEVRGGEPDYEYYWL